jgi:hypothetical protein
MRIPWVRVGTLLILAVLALGMDGALGAISITNTLSPGYGTIDYSITSDGTQMDNYAINENQGYDSTQVKIEGVYVRDATSFTGDISATTYYGDHADTSVDFSGSSDVKVDNFNIYGYLTPNLAWTGQYTEEVEAEHISFDGNAYTRDDTPNSKGYQDSNLGPWKTEGSTAGSADFTASEVYTTNQAGGSYDPTEYNVGTQNAWGGEGTYAMSNVESGSFSIASTTRASDEDWEINDPHAYSQDSQVAVTNHYIEASAGDVQRFEYGPLTFTVNTPAMNYADADIVYSDTDFGVSGYAGAEMDQQKTYAERYNYFPRTDLYLEDDDKQDHKPLSTFDNVFSYGYVNVPQNILHSILKADVIFY